MKLRKLHLPLLLALGAALFIFALPARATEAVQEEGSAQAERDFITWMKFDIPYAALNRAMELDIQNHGTEHPADWVEVLSYLAAKNWGNWSRYRPADMEKLAGKIKEGQSISSLAEGLAYYNYYREAYGAVLSGFLGTYLDETSGNEGGGGETREEKYGLKVFSPIAKGFWYTHYDDFGNKRSYGYARIHLGNDLLGSVGTPVIAVESGVVEALGWNQYGGWRIGIRSFDGKRYYYYAHLRKNWPYVKTLKEGQTVHAGDVIGYLGRTGYSTTENVNNIKTSHLHFGMQIIFDESQKEGPGEIWIDVYEIVKLLSRNKSEVSKDPETREYHSVKTLLEPEYEDRFSAGNSA
ncbi:M23 family metallopeptidase [Papillibacter cinnamivorans]|uniref:Peptidase family M23 n=1 Tax=Papillibacter cinnamivorans DSM 12816 TaxID=1122930 RepID=A0A1W2A5W5_9FIRM|nr:M23 family metallopeptidase [Papillibacter cinnamivorans]SMC55862.1 Peptidase family M23 [Papillibacter cinnamivorans DSM 12816]